MKKKQYFKPLIEKIILDNTISLQMASPNTIAPENPTRSNSQNQKGTSDPFASPFGDKPFN